jgi:hypothetical protein
MHLCPMSLSVSWFFIQTPIPWATILCIILYRHDLSQLVHPFKDRCSIRDWKSVFQDLDIPLEISSSSAKQSGIPRVVVLILHLQADISERYPNIGFYTLVLAIVAGSSLLSSLVVVHVLMEDASFLNSRFSEIISAGLQFVSAFPSIFAMQRYFGPLPSAPGKFHLKKRRPGSLLRYEETLLSLKASEKICL